MVCALSSQSSTDSLASLHCPSLLHTAARSSVGGEKRQQHMWVFKEEARHEQPPSQLSFQTQARLIFQNRQAPAGWHPNQILADYAMSFSRIGGKQMSMHLKVRSSASFWIDDLPLSTAMLSTRPARGIEASCSSREPIRLAPSVLSRGTLQGQQAKADDAPMSAPRASHVHFKSPCRASIASQASIGTQTPFQEGCRQYNMMPGSHAWAVYQKCHSHTCRFSLGYVK